ncbi:Cytochrome P450 [Lishizhenia tianjinensis]|uniref:Cytochrome P450 n=1 Tax=Lishizhenia tianjinensis TaxID=477690 RepID=A0A1I6Y167_9FLAO|nr:cytochrome P450 [Lishizhenia tianjinensis]SFT43884.1 Cytochrome P450 [Lishizhenia tianjinensis]
MLSKDLPGPKGKPIVGNMFEVDINNLHNQLSDWVDEYGDVFNLNLGLTNMLIVAKPSMIDYIQKNRPTLFRRMDKLNNVLKEEGISGVFNAEGEEWKRHRMMVAKGLDIKHQIAFFPWMMTVTDRLKRKWQKDVKEQGAFSIQDDFLRYTVDVSTNLAFGKEMNTLEERQGAIQDDMEKVFPMIFKRINQPIPWYKWFKSKADKEYNAATDRLQEFVDDVITSTKQKLHDNPSLKENPQNFLEAIIVAAEEDQHFNDADIRSNLLTLLLAGEDTTAHTLTWAITLLNDQPEVIAKAREEVDRVLGEHQTVTRFEQLQQLEYIGAVINEVMRLKPVAPITLYQPNEDVEVEGVKIPKDSRMLLHLRKSATMEEHFSRAGEFVPERWIKAKSQCPVHNTAAYNPFGGGPRYCPGANLALTEMKLVLAMLFKNFDFKLETNVEDIKEIMAFTMMASDFKVSFTPRKNNH